MLIAFPAQFTFNQRESPLATLRAICLPLKSLFPPSLALSSFLLLFLLLLFSLHRARFERSYVPWTEYVKARWMAQVLRGIKSLRTDPSCSFFTFLEIKEDNRPFERKIVVHNVAHLKRIYPKRTSLTKR